MCQEEDDRKKQEEAAERARNQARLQAEYAEAQRYRGSEWKGQQSPIGNGEAINTIDTLIALGYV